MEVKKILIVDGIFPINTRSYRIYKSLGKSYEIKYCSWDRKNQNKKIQNENYIYSSNEGYGNKLKKLLGIYKYYKYLSKKIKEYKPHIIIASQWDMLILTSLVKSDNQYLIYDNIDLPSTKNSFILKFIQYIEKICILKKVDGIIYASRFFDEYYKKINKRKLILENKPLKELKTEKSIEYITDRKKIVFMGTIRYYELFEKLVEALKEYQEEVELLFFGEGHAEEKLKRLVKKNKQTNVKFMGRYNYSEIGLFYNVSDYVWAVYPSADFNVKYAISNKFHESLLFEKPCFYSKNTKLGEYVEENSIGYSIDENKLQEELKKILSLKNIKKLSFEKYKEENTNLYWEDDEEKLFRFIKNILESR